MSDVWVKVKMPGELHEKFRRWAFDHGTSMQESIVSRVRVLCGEPGKPFSVQTPPAAAKGLFPTDQQYVEDMTKILERGEPVDPLTHQCHICKDNFPQTKMQYHAKTMKWVCLGCAENQKNSQ